MTFAIVASAVLSVGPGCPRSRRGRDAGATLTARCDRLELVREWALAGTEGRALGASATSAGEGALIAWLEHTPSGGALAMARRVTLRGLEGERTTLLELAPPPAASALPSLAFHGDTGWVVAWDERAGCRALAIDARGARRGSVRTLGPEPCFGPALGPEGRGNVLRPSAEGWRAVPIEAHAASPGPIAAPQGERWLARAADGVTAYVVDEHTVRVRRPGEPERPPLSSAQGRVAFLAIARVGEGYVVAWSREGEAGGSAQWLGVDLEPVGDPERLPVGGSGLAVAAFGREAWIVGADTSGAIELVRLSRSDRLPGLALVRNGKVGPVDLAVVPGGAVIAYNVEREERADLYAIGVRCAAAQGEVRPR